MASKYEGAGGSQSSTQFIYKINYYIYLAFLHLNRIIHIQKKHFSEVFSLLKIVWGVLHIWSEPACFSLLKIEILFHL